MYILFINIHRHNIRDEFLALRMVLFINMHTHNFRDEILVLRMVITVQSRLIWNVQVS